MKRLPIIGLSLTVLGLFLALAFWPLATVSGAELLTAKNGNQYVGYATGSKITIHEKALDVTFSNFLGSPFTTLELDDGDPDVSTSLLVRGDARGVVTSGEVVYATAVLQSVTILGTAFFYWEVATPQDVHPSWPVDAVFYGIMASGVVVLAYAALRRP